MSGEEAALAAVMVGGGLWLLTPLVRALSERIRQRPELDADRADTQALEAHIGRLQQDVLELQERVDFAERLLAKQREPDRLGPGGR